ncbi:hypothetical protein [Chitinophaga arvensicola]|nr:hypothetical protein [Chitinophaga arvensicola]
MRKITVGTTRYAWRVKGGDEGLHLSVIPLKQQQYLLTGGFGYHSVVTGTSIAADGQTMTHLKPTLVITGFIVRQVIIYALNAGWLSDANKRILHVGAMDDEVSFHK